MKDGANSFFSPDYAEARSKFLEAARASSAQITNYIHPLRGPKGEELATDVAEFGATDASKALFVCSATHGVEGFSGSAIQIGLMREGLVGQLPKSTKLILIHAINPFGFAYLRRFTEGNVDLNRNFLSPGDTRPENLGYDALARWITPQSLSPMSEMAALFRLILYASRNGIARTRNAVTSGQFRYPEGLFYGGDDRSWSADTLEKIIKHHGTGVSRAVFFDVHTGLGPKAAAEIISNSPKNSKQFVRACSIWGDEVKSTKAAESVSADLAGTLKLAVIKMLPDSEMTAVSIEYGTVPALVALRALRAENWLHRNGESGTSRARRIKKNLLSAFNPNEDEWRDAVWRKGKSALTAAIEWIANEPARPMGRD